MFCWMSSTVCPRVPAAKLTVNDPAAVALAQAVGGDGRRPVRPLRIDHHRGRRIRWPPAHVFRDDLGGRLRGFRGHQRSAGHGAAGWWCESDRIERRRGDGWPGRRRGWRGRRRWWHGRRHGQGRRLRLRPRRQTGCVFGPGPGPGVGARGPSAPKRKEGLTCEGLCL